LLPGTLTKLVLCAWMMLSIAHPANHQTAEVNYQPVAELMLAQDPIVTKIQTHEQFIRRSIQDKQIATPIQIAIPTQVATRTPFPTFVPIPTPTSWQWMDQWHWSRISPQQYVRRIDPTVPDCSGLREVSHRTWMMPFPQYVIGWASYYSPGLMQHQVTYRGVDLSTGPYLGGVSLMSPADLLKPVWIKLPGSDIWEGPYISVDASGREHYCVNIYERNLVVEVSWETWQSWGRDDSMGPVPGVEVWVGSLPPECEGHALAGCSVDPQFYPLEVTSVPQVYWPELIWKGEP